MAGLLCEYCHSGQREALNPASGDFRVRANARPGMTIDQANAGIGRNRLIAPMVMRTKNTSTRPCTTANTGPEGGLPGATAVSAGILRNDWITKTNTLR